MNFSRINLKTLFPILAVGAFITHTSVQANEKNREERLSTLDEIYEIVERGLPRTISDDNSALAKDLLSVKASAPLEENIKLDGLLNVLFESTPKVQGDCELRSADLNCLASVGEKAGAGDYAQLKIFSSNSEANLRFAKRSQAGTKLVPVKIEDREAYEKSISLLQNFGLNSAEIPVAPSNASNPYPVKTVNVAVAQEEKAEKVIAIEKLVSLPRGLYAGKLGWIPGPGEWMVSMNDAGINMAAVRNWADMSRYGQDLRVDQVKSRKTLVDELVERFQHEGIQKLSSARSHIMVARLEGAEVPVPVLRVFASPQEQDLTEEEQALVVSSAGVVFDIPLFAKYDENENSDD